MINLSELRKFFKLFLLHYGSLFFVTLMGILTFPNLTIQAITITLAIVLIAMGFKKEYSKFLRGFSLALGVYLLLGFIVKSVQIELVFALYPYQLGTVSPTNIVTLSSIYVFVFVFALIAGMMKEGEEVWESAGAVGLLGAVIFVLYALFTDVTIFASLMDSIPLISNIVNSVGAVGTIMGNLLGLTIAVLLVYIFALSLIHI